MSAQPPPRGDRGEDRRADRDGRSDDPGGRRARLVTVRIDEATWTTGSAARRQEWRATIDDLLGEHVFDVPGHHLELTVTFTDDQVHFEAGADGAPLPPIDVPMARLKAHLDEYLDACRKMLAAGRHNAAQLEAYDIAKRIIHDEAGEALQEACAALGPDHATCRRLFTLIVALHTDTTRLAIGQHARDVLRHRR